MAKTHPKGFLAALSTKDVLAPAKPNEIDKQTAGHISSIKPPAPAVTFTKHKINKPTQPW